MVDPNGAKRQGQFTESTKLLKWGFDNFRRVTISQGNDPVDKVAVTLSRQADEVMVKPEGEVVRTLPKDLDPSLIETTIHLNSDTVEAPVEEGQVLGTMTLSYEGTDYGSLDLVAVTSVERSELLYKKAQVMAFFQNFGVRVAAVIILILVVAVLLKVLGHVPGPPELSGWTALNPKLKQGPFGPFFIPSSVRQDSSSVCVAETFTAKPFTSTPLPTGIMMYFFPSIMQVSTR